MPFYPAFRARSIQLAAVLLLEAPAACASDAHAGPQLPPASVQTPAIPAQTAASPVPTTHASPTPPPSATPAPPPSNTAQSACGGPAIASWENGQPVPVSFTLCAWQSNPLGPVNRVIEDNPPLSPDDAEIADYYYDNQPANDFLYADASQANEGADTNFPIFVAKTTDPVVIVHCNYFGPCSLDGAKMYIPSQAKPAGASDHHIAIIQPDGATEYDFETVTDARPYSGTLSKPGSFKAAIGGIVKLDGSLYDGTQPPGADGGHYPNIAPGWLNQSSPGTAGGMSHSAGTIFASELAAGQINHAIAAVSVCLKNQTGSWPAQIGVSSSSICPNGRGIRYGAHLWYDRPVSWVRAQPLPPDVQTILIALHTYGAFISLTGGAGKCPTNQYGGDGCGFDVFKFENQEPYWQYGHGVDPVAAHASSAPGWSLLRPGQYHLANPNAALIDLQHHLHVLSDCATGIGPWPAFPSC